MTCLHKDLITVPSEHAAVAGYKARSDQQLRSAGALKTPLLSHYPHPLVLPDDDLALDPECPPQTLKDWLDDPDRNHITPDRNVIYVSSPPSVAQDTQVVHDWIICADSSTISDATTTPSAIDVMSYLEAFYYGMRVRPLPQPLTFSAWTSPGKAARAASATPRYIGLDTSEERIRVRTRVCPDKAFARQLNSDDLLDAALSVLPDDAYALLLLVEHDLWEGAGDEFICGRAYGASRIAIVSTARYSPALDERQDVERLHAWPASHCAAYVREQCASSAPRRKKRKVETAPIAGTAADAATGSSLHAAIASYVAHGNSESDAGLWLARVCRTAAHELGHCFGLDHCVFRACSMQGSASVREDARQPLYLCPVDRAKVLHATGQTDNGQARDQALVRFCLLHKGESAIFAAFAAWLNSSTALLLDC